MTIQPIPFVLLLLLTFLLELRMGVTISGCIANERNALLNFKKSLIDKRNRFVSWNGEDCCNWKGVSCNNLTGHVVRLDLRNPYPLSIPYNILYNEWSLRGQLSPSLFWLKRLNYLDLSMNYFYDPIPKFIGSFRNLRYLNLSRAGFHGLIPHHLRNLSRLEYLDLSFNALNAYLPDWFGEMHKMKTLELSGNLLFGFIPESLVHLMALEELFLSYNKLNGTVPKSIGQLSNLLVLDLRKNSLEGVMSEVHFTRLAKLKKLGLGSNNLILNVSHDWIPPFKLNAIDMGSYKIGPHFPQWLKTQVNLSFLNLSSSGIVDILPDWFWDVFVTHDLSTVTLDLSNNGITGNLPPPSKLNFLYFDLSSNFFKGPLPTSLSVSENLMLFDVSNNSFSGSIQPILGNNPPLLLYLSRNNFSGEIPLSICLAHVGVIDLSRNNLTGELPNCWRSHQFYEQARLDFSENNLSGNIPSSLCTAAGLTSLHLSHNNLSGSFPTTLRNCVDLEILDLSMNNLTGKIPTWIGEDLINLKVLVLRSNNFMGNVPSNLSKLKKLRTLVLANNKLTGVIPRSFGNFRHMMDMQLGEENIGPAITNTFNLRKHMDYAQITIKKRDWNYDKLLYKIANIDLSSNNLSARIPKELGNLHGLMQLNLSGNHLVGSIPDAIGLMHSLESLDLSRNELSGNIPSTMSTMTTLNSLDLSYNNLSGKIPSGPQLQTFSNKSYIGNPKLCGFPLTPSCDSNKTSNVEVSVDEVTESDYWYVTIAPGFVLGVCIVWGTFLVKKKWTSAYFRYVDHVYDAIYVFTVVNINKFKRKIGNETTLD